MAFSRSTCDVCGSAARTAGSRKMGCVPAQGKDLQCQRGHRATCSITAQSHLPSLSVVEVVVQQAALRKQTRHIALVIHGEEEVANVCALRPRNAQAPSACGCLKGRVSGRGSHTTRPPGDSRAQRHGRRDSCRTNLIHYQARPGGRQLRRVFLQAIPNDCLAERCAGCQPLTGVQAGEE
jgi:hypothetical protein